MTAPELNPPPPDTTGRHDGTEQVAVALLAAPVGSGGGCAQILLTAALESGMRRANVEFKAAGAMFTPCFIVATYDVPDRKSALRSLHQTIETELKLPAWGIAYFDTAEHFWRTVAGIHFRFEVLFSKENFEAAELALARSQELTKQLEEHLLKLQSERPKEEA